MDRFWKKVNKSDDCWLWTATKGSSGYGHFRFREKQALAHRVSWILTYGEIENSLHVCHKCDIKLCVNPDHLFLGTNRDNMRDKVNRGLQTYGDSHGTTKIPDAIIQAIRESSECYKILAERYQLRSRYVRRVKLGRIRNKQNLHREEPCTHE